MTLKAYYNLYMKSNMEEVMNDLERQGIAVLRAGLPATVDKVRMTGEPVVIQKNNKDVAAIVPLRDLERLTRSKGKAGGK